MDCTEILSSEVEQLDLPNVDSFLIIGNTRRVAWVINRLRLKNKDQHFSSIAHETRTVSGHYDVAIIDGADNWINARLLFEELYPYLKQNVKKFYIITE